MKKIIIILITLLIITGCHNKKIETNSINITKKETETTSKEKKETYIDNNPIKLGIYLYTNSYTNRKLLTEYSTDWIEGTDLCSLEIYYTTEEFIPGTNQKNIWNTYYSNYQNIDNFHIGYHIEFNTKDNQINKNILSPQDTEEIFDYIQLYLYDDVNQEDDAWYSHVTNEQYNENTILTSIKLTGSSKTNEITSDIILTAFTYDNDDFDENNNYRGNSKTTITIKRN